MGLERPIEKASETVNKASQAVRSRLSILDDKQRCPECNSPMEAGYAYDPRVAAFYPNGERPAWLCENCGYKEAREESKVTVDPYN